MPPKPRARNPSPQQEGKQGEVDGEDRVDDTKPCYEWKSDGYGHDYAFLVPEGEGPVGEVRTPALFSVKGVVVEQPFLRKSTYKHQIYVNLDEADDTHLRRMFGTWPKAKGPVTRFRFPIRDDKGTRDHRPWSFHNVENKDEDFFDIWDAAAPEGADTEGKTLTPADIQEGARVLIESNAYCWRLKDGGEGGTLKLISIGLLERYVSNPCATDVALTPLLRANIGYSFESPKRRRVEDKLGK